MSGRRAVIGFVRIRTDQYYLGIIWPATPTLSHHKRKHDKLMLANQVRS